MKDCRVFHDDPVRTNELLGLIDTYQRFTCPARVDEESLLIAALYGVIIFLHGVGILTGAHLELTPDEFDQHLRMGTVENKHPSESARLLAVIGRRLLARNPNPDALGRFIHYAGRTYRSFLEKRSVVQEDRQESMSEYETNRAFRIAIYPWVWLWNTLDDFALPIRIPNDQNLAKMLGLTNQITYMRNDIGTLRRDVHDGIKNYILYLDEDLGCGRSRATELAKERCNDKVKEFMALERVIMSSPADYPEHEAMAYVGFLKSLLIGNLLALDAFGSTEYVERDTLVK
jgi:Terpene synthase family 2, C-terminal metal binding